LAALRQGLSGITQGVDMALRDKEMKRQKVDVWYEGILSGKIDPRITGTQQFMDYTKKLGIYDDSSVQTMIQAGQKAWRKSGIGPPGQKTIMDFQNTLAEEERKRARQKELDKVETFEIKENIKHFVEDKWKSTPEQQFEDWLLIQDKLKSSGMWDQIKNQTFKFGGVTTTFAGAYDVLQDKIRVGEKAETEYFRLHKEIGEDRIEMIRTVERVDEGQKPSSITALVNFMIKEKGMSVEEMDRTKPDDLIKRYVKARNDLYKIKYDRLRKLAPGTRQKVPKFKPFNAEAFIKGEVEVYKPRESFKPEEARGKIMPPTGDLREEIMQNALGDIHLRFKAAKETTPDYSESDLIDFLERNRQLAIDQYGLTEKEFEEVLKMIRGEK